jgi:hypothetical protein
MSEPSDIGNLASLARTALTDPGALPEGDGVLVTATGVYLPRADIAVGFLDEIIAITDPRDDEREFANYADSLDALGRAMGRIREQVLQATRQDDLREHANTANVVDTNVTDALELVSTAATYLREAQEIVDAPPRCEDCEINGEECSTHGEAWKLARRAVLENPGRVLALLKEEVPIR